MANSLGTLAGKVVAARVLELIAVQFPLLTRIASNFSDQGLLFNQDLVVHVPTVGSVSDYSTSDGYVPQDSTTTDRTVKIDQHKHYSVFFNDQEVTSTDRRLIDEQAEPAAYALGKDLFDYAFGKFVAANYPYEHVKAAADFNRRTAIDLNGILNKRGIPSLGRFAVEIGRAHV